MLFRNKKYKTAFHRHFDVPYRTHSRGKIEKKLSLDKFSLLLEQETQNLAKENICTR